MRKLLIILLLIVLGIFSYNYFAERDESRQRLIESSSLIQKEVRNVGKLIVTEGTFAQVFTYNDSKRMYFDLLTASKKALVVVNAKVNISYDLRAMETQVDEENRTITILSIPKPEININPDIEYYDVTQDYLNQFEASDYNTIKKRVNASIRKKVEASRLPEQAEQRLISELASIYAVTNALGWELRYNKIVIQSNDQLQKMIID